MCTKQETISTGINIETVKESKLKPQDIFNDSESIHLNKWIDTGRLFKPTSKKANIAQRVVIITDIQVINCAPCTPIKPWLPVLLVDRFFYLRGLDLVILIRVILLKLDTLFEFYCNTTF